MTDSTETQAMTASETAASDLQQAARTTSILTVVSGVSALIFGILILVWPQTTLLVVAVLFGLQLLIAGIVRVVSGAMDSSAEGWHRGLSITFGVLIGLAGIFCLRNPALSLLTIIVIVAVGWLIDGVVNVVLGAQSPRGHRAGRIVMGIVFLIGAILLLAFPSTALLTFVFLGGWILIAFGIVILIAGIVGLRAVRKLA